MPEFGLFSDEGCVEAQFYTRAEAETAIKDRYHPDDELQVLEVCEYHPEEPKVGCLSCD